jgi:hypothetical protein
MNENDKLLCILTLRLAGGHSIERRTFGSCTPLSSQENFLSHAGPFSAVVDLQTMLFTQYAVIPQQYILFLPLFPFFFCSLSDPGRTGLHSVGTDRLSTWVEACQHPPFVE